MRIKLVAILHPASAMLLAICMVATAGGCGSNETASEPEAESVYDRIGAYHSPPSDRPIRLTEVHHALVNDLTIDVLEFPVDGPWQVINEARLKQSGEGLTVKHPDQITLQHEAAFDASLYNELQVEMSVSAGRTCTFSWTSDLMPTQDRRGARHATVIADNNFHVYRIPLDSSDDVPWAGVIDSVRFSPSDMPGEYSIRSFRFARVPSKAPQRVTVDYETQEALYGSLPPWTFTVPEGGRFAVSVGKTMPASRADSIIQLSVDRSTRTLLQKTLTPGDISFERHVFDLAEFAGREVTVEMTVDHLGLKRHDFVYWGAPTVFASNVQDAVPIVLISCDTVRADHLSPYRYEFDTTPNLDEWARNDAVVFENALTTETWTLPSHASMLTGLYPVTHRASAAANISEDHVLLGEFLRQQGYLTAGYTGFRHWLAPWRGMAQGFDVYNTPRDPVREMFETEPLLFSWIDDHPYSNTFIFAHNYDAHDKHAYMGFTAPYGTDHPDFQHFRSQVPLPPRFESEDTDDLPEPDPENPRASEIMMAANAGQISLTPAEIAHCIAGYNDSLRLVDHHVQQLFDKLKSVDLYEKALIIVTADHGEEFAEHGLFGHNQVYEECARVPLMIKFPDSKFAGQRVSSVVSLVDLFPTVVDAIDAEFSGTLEGQSLLALLEGEVTPRDDAFVQRKEQQALRRENWKLIQSSVNQDRSLFDLARDPSESQNVITDNSPRADALGESLAEFYASALDGWHIELSLPESGWDATLTVECARPIDQFRMLTADVAFGASPYRHLMHDRSDNAVTINMHKFQHTDEEVIIRPAAVMEPVRLTIASDSRFMIRKGNNEPEQLESLDLYLDPADFGGHSPALALESTNGEPAVTIWFEPPDIVAEPARELTEEEEAELRGLGYVN